MCRQQTELKGQKLLAEHARPVRLKNLKQLMDPYRFQKSVSKVSEPEVSQCKQLRSWFKLRMY
jgi:hypothetical protein